MRAGEPPVEQRTITFDFAGPRRSAGSTSPSSASARSSKASASRSSGNEVTVPTWRRDVEGPADLVEEVARIIGYDQVPSTPLDRAPGSPSRPPRAAQLVERQVRRTAAARGLDEAVTWSFISEAEAAGLRRRRLALANPISEDMKVMRPSLLPGLIAAARRNLDRGASRSGCSRSAAAISAMPSIRPCRCCSPATRAPRDWQIGQGAEPFDAFDAKAEALALLEAAGAPVANLQVFPDAGPTWHPGRSAKLGLGPKTILASFGELHPGLGKSLDAPAGAVAAEIYLDAIPAPRSSGRARSAYAPPALQSMTRDFAFIVPAELTADTLLRALRGSDKEAITGVRLFDRFESADGLSLAFEVTLQPGEKSFTDEQIGEISGRIIAAAEKLGARLRS